MAFYSYLSTKIIIAFITKSYQDLFGVRSYINAFYLKTVLKDGVFITAELHYPNNEKEYYSKLISKIFTNFPN